jgi:hypothetical protein
VYVLSVLEAEINGEKRKEEIEGNKCKEWRNG